MTKTPSSIISNFAKQQERVYARVENSNLKMSPAAKKLCESALLNNLMSGGGDNGPEEKNESYDNAKRAYDNMESKKQLFETAKSKKLELEGQLVDNPDDEGLKSALQEAIKNLNSAKKAYENAFLNYEGISLALYEYRELWKKEIKNIGNIAKKSIIEAAKNIDVNENFVDGNRLIEIGINGHTYKILDVNLDKYSDNEYKHKLESPMGTKFVVDNSSILYEKNKKFEDYKISKNGSYNNIYLSNLFDDLHARCHLKSNSEILAMFMYLTGLTGSYTFGQLNLSLNDDERSMKSLDECDEDGTSGICFISV